MNIQDPQNLPRGARRFLTYLLQDTAYGIAKRGVLSLIPLRMIICGLIGTLASAKLGEKFTNEPSISVAFYAAVLTLNAILMAVCWGAFAKIFDSITDPKFGQWMRLRKIDSYYEFYIDYIHLAQMIATITAATALTVSVLSGIPYFITALLFGFTIGSTGYAGWWSFGGVRIMQEISEQRAKFLANPDDVHLIQREGKQA